MFCGIANAHIEARLFLLYSDFTCLGCPKVGIFYFLFLHYVDFFPIVQIEVVMLIISYKRWSSIFGHF